MQISNLSKLSHWVKLFRQAKKWSQTRLAFEAGVERSFISRLESGEYRSGPSDKIDGLALVLKQSPEMLEQWGKTLAFPLASCVELIRENDEPKLVQTPSLSRQMHEIATAMVREDDTEARLVLHDKLLLLADEQYYNALYSTERAKKNLFRLANALAEDNSRMERQINADLLVRLSELLEGYSEEERIMNAYPLTEASVP